MYITGKRGEEINNKLTYILYIYLSELLEDKSFL